MKLRSGKILKYELPFRVEKKLNHAITEFKSLLVHNEDFAKELIKLIASEDNLKALCSELQYKIDNSIYSETVNSIQATTGLLARLFLGKEVFHKNSDIQSSLCNKIQIKILEAFDMDVSLIGVTEQYSDDMEIE